MRHRATAGSLAALNYKTVEQVGSFTLLECKLTCKVEEDIDSKITSLSHKCRRIRQALKWKTRPSPQMKSYQVVAVPTAVCRTETRTMKRSREISIQAVEIIL